MGTYNGARFIGEQLESILQQRLLPIEVQIGDDGSTDHTEEIVRNFAERAPFDVFFTRNSERLGYGENFLRTARRCRGDWIAFSDQDDIWLPSKLSTLANAIRLAPDDAVLVTHDAVVADETGTSLGIRLGGHSGGTFPSLALPGTWLCNGFLQMFHSSLVNDFPLWPRAETPHPRDNGSPDMVRYPHDGWIPILANATGTIVRLADVLAIYRRHSDTVTTLNFASPREEMLMTLENHGQRYGELAQWYFDTADVLLSQRNSARQAAHATIDKAIDRFRQEGTDLAVRQELYCSNGIAHRYRLFLRLLRSGAYHRRWSMRPASAIKDLAHVMRPAAL